MMRSLLLALSVAGVCHASEPIREFRASWQALGAIAGTWHPHEDEVHERARVAASALGALGPEGHAVLLEYLERPHGCFVNEQFIAFTGHARLQGRVIEVLETHGVVDAVPVLSELVMPRGVLGARTDPPGQGSRTVERACYRLIAPAAARALGTLGDPSAVPALREAFDEAFEHLPRGAPLLAVLPDVLLTLGDGPFLIERLTEHLGSEDRALASRAVIVAQQLPPGEIVPLLVDRLCATGDRNAQQALELTTGQPLLTAGSWRKWWDLNAGRPPGDWVPLPATPADRRAWARCMIEMLNAHDLGPGPRLRSSPSGNVWTDAYSTSSWVASKAVDLDIEEPLRRFLASVVERSRDGLADAGVAARANGSLAALDCFGEKADCVEWKRLVEGGFGAERTSMPASLARIAPAHRTRLLAGVAGVAGVAGDVPCGCVETGGVP